MTRKQLQAQVNSLKTQINEQPSVEQLAACIASTQGINNSDSRDLVVAQKRSIVQISEPNTTDKYMVAAQALQKILKRNKDPS